MLYSIASYVNNEEVQKVGLFKLQILLFYFNMSLKFTKSIYPIYQHTSMRDSTAAILAPCLYRSWKQQDDQVVSHQERFLDREQISFTEHDIVLLVS